MLLNFIDNGKIIRKGIYQKILIILKDVLDYFENQYMFQFYAR
jgi:hypothetical protein